MQKRKKNIFLGVLAASFVLLMIGSMLAESSLSTLTSGSSEDESIYVDISDHGLGAEESGYDSHGLGGIEVDTYVWPYPSQDLTITPYKQVTEEGSATYKVVFKDSHQDGCIRDSDLIACTNVYRMYKYELSFKSPIGNDGDFVGEFEEHEFSIGPGQTFTTTLTVSTRSEGEHSFLVSVKGKNYEASAMGVLVYSPESVREVELFVGNGFILSKNEAKGELAYFVILRTGSGLFGKATIGDQNFVIKGEELASPAIFPSKNYIKLDLISARTGEVSATFKGYVQKFSDFKVLKGTLKDFNDENWSVIAYRTSDIIPPQPIEPQAEDREDVIDVTPSREEA